MNRCELAPGDVPASQDRPQSQPGEATEFAHFDRLPLGPSATRGADGPDGTRECHA